MTRRGYGALQEQLRRLKLSERPKVAEALRVARGHGDLSENAEYEAAKERQAHLEGRIAQLEDKLARAEVVDPSRVSLDRVRFATTVMLEDQQSGDEVSYTLVGEEEADIRNRMISVQSPIGRALIGKAVDEEVTVRAPAGTRSYRVLEIKGMDEG